MGMIYVAIKMLPNPLILILTQLKLMVTAALTHLGVFKQPPPPDDEDQLVNLLNNYVLIVDGSSHSLIPTPVHAVIAAIKIRVPLVPYGDFLEKLKQGGGGGAEGGEEQGMCTVCLEKVERSDEIRELYNCDHVFHGECLDTWVEGGQVTCPLCRALLLPPKKMVSRLDGISFRQRPISRVY